jgi:Uncharacterized protein conserved in bacteria
MEVLTCFLSEKPVSFGKIPVMPSQIPPEVSCGSVFPLMPVSDVSAAIDYYTRQLGFKLGFTWGDPPKFAGVNLGEVSVHLSANGPGAPASAAYFVVSDAEELFDFHISNGVTVVESPADRDYGLRDYRVKDPWGNELGFGHYIYSAGPAVKIERIDVSLRLEKRLAALMQDLAEHKRMSLNSCMEEILLHTLEIAGDGVASPHTMRTLKYIQTLKQKHGIDYDTHDSYRFQE